MENDVFTKKSHHIGDKTVSYYRPSQSRKIPLKTLSNRGFIPSLKSHLNNVVLEYESQLERDYYLLLDQDMHCIDLQPQPVKLSYETVTGRKATLSPDCWAIFDDEQEFLFEIKSEQQLQKLVDSENWEHRMNAIHSFCNTKNWNYQIITENQINCTRLHNIKDLLAAAKHYAPLNLTKELGTFNSKLSKILDGTEKTFAQLVKLLKVFLPLKLEEIISLLKYKIYFQQIYIDWDIPIQNTSLSLTGHYPDPVYTLPNRYSSQEYYTTDKEQATILSTKDQEKYQERLNLLKDIINQFGKEAKKPDIAQYCTQHNQPFHRTYEWYLVYRKEGKEGLVPKRYKKHIKSHLKPQVERLLQEAINFWNRGEWQQKKAAYNEFYVKCLYEEVKPCSYTTFIHRIHQLPASEKRGKFKPKTQSFIERGLSGTYKEGRYPGAVIQLDHTPLDIWLVDSFTKQPLGRPNLLVGIDVFSRSLWGYHLSFEEPTQETVTQVILHGLLPKYKSADWKIIEAELIKKGIDPKEYISPCSGFPAMLQVDNGMIFQAYSVKEFCMKHNITLEFRPVKTPQYGGFIESLWSTINDGIRGAKLPGRVFSLPKSREAVKQPKFYSPPGYNPKKEAALTLDEFKEWLLLYFSVNYSARTRAHQQHSPNEIWVDGVRGENHQPMGGALRILTSSEYEVVDFESKITVASTLSAKGLRYKNILYSSEWLRTARIKKTLIDGCKYQFKVSHRDIRRAFIKDPATTQIELLEAYKFDGDDRISKFITRGLGKTSGYKGFPISLQDLQRARKSLGTSHYNEDEHLIFTEEFTKKLRKKGTFNKKEKKFIETLLKTKGGREKISAATIIVQMDEEPLPSSELMNEELTKIEDDEQEEIKPYPTTWDEAKKDMFFTTISEQERKQKKEVKK